VLLLNSEKSNGPSSEPWRTPEITEKNSEKRPLRPTHCTLNVKEDLINEIAFEEKCP
jgi:hypothetical protein